MSRGYSSLGLTPGGAKTEAQDAWQSTWASKGHVEKLRDLGDTAYLLLPICMTCDSMGVSSDVDVPTQRAQVQARFSCLHGNYLRVSSLPESPAPFGVSRAALEAALVRKMKLLFELKGALLSTSAGQGPDTRSQQQKAMDLYVERPGSGNGCGTPWQPPSVLPACPSLPILPGLNATLAMCDQGLEAHVSVGTAEVMLDRCSVLARTIASLSAADCGGTEYRREYARINEALLTKTLQGTSSTLGTETQVAELHRKLASIQQWYGRSREHLYPGPTPAPELLASSSRLLKAFWNSVYLEDVSSLNPVTDAESESVRRQVLHDGMLADLQVLRAAFGAAGSPPMTGAPLLYLVGDSLRGLQERLGEISRLHDMGCRFKRCSTAPTATSQTWDILSALGDPDRLEASVGAATLVDSNWRAAFDLMQSNHVALQTAVKDALGFDSYASKSLLATPLDGLTAPALSLSALMREAKARTSGYQANGLMITSDARRVEVGLDNARQDQILAHLNGIITALENSIASYDANRLLHVQGLLEELRNQDSQTSINNHAELLLEQLRQLSQDLDGLRTTHAVDEIRYGDFMKGFEALFPAMEDSGGDIVKRQHTLSVPGRGRMAGAPDDVLGMAVETGPSSGVPFKLTAAAGEQLVLQVNGMWSPTCALSLTEGPNGSLVRVRKENHEGGNHEPIMTGPEGYSVVSSETEYTAKANQTVVSDGKYDNKGDSRQSCAGFDTSRAVPGGVGLITARAEACTKSDTGETWSEVNNKTNSSGGETRSTFSANRGLRSPMAPFTDQPVGSLLLVRMHPGGSRRSDIRSIQVVRAPTTAVLAPADSDYYLVVNDRVDTLCRGMTDTALNIQITHLQPQSVAARRMSSAMVEALAQMLAESEGYVAQGRLLPHQTELLRSRAFTLLYTQCSCTDLSYYPRSLVQLFETWVDKAVVDVEREVELVNIERQVRALMLELRALDADLNGAQQQSRLLALYPAWALRNMDGAKLRAQIEALDQVLSDWLSPIIALRHPETLTSFNTFERQLIDQFTSVDPFNTDIRELAVVARDMAQMVEQRLRAVRAAASTPTRNDVIVSIPRPGRPVNSPWKKVDPATAQTIWSAILSGGNPMLHLKPDFIYSAAGGQKVLPCNFSAPIIHSMALYVAWPSAPYPQPTDIPVTVAPGMAFPTLSGKQQYEFINARYLGPYVAMMFGPSLDAPGAMASYWDRSGNMVATGISPFSSYHLDLRSFAEGNPLADADELLVGFRLEPRHEAPGARLPGVPQCE